MAANNHEKFILWFNEIGIGDVPLVGGETLLLEKCTRNSTEKELGIKVEKA